MLAAFIPARGGSKRIPGKNIRPFHGHPLLAYAIQGARDAGIFDGGIYVSTDCAEIGEIAQHYGATFIKRPDEYAGDRSPDAEWIKHLLSVIRDHAQHFAILRPVNPFRTGKTILRAHGEWDGRSLLKAVEPVAQHPGKMWIIAPNPKLMLPLWPGSGHLCQTNTLQPLYVQNASLEFRAGVRHRTFQPFMTAGYEGFDLNTPDDWILAEALVERGLVGPPEIRKEAPCLSLRT